jgi:hypothetical protein
MTKQFFDRFPIIQYSNNNVRNIFARVVLDEKTKETPENFVQVILPDHMSQRADLIADSYYDSPYFDWLYFIGNDIIDPYDVYLDGNSFYNMIITKYNDLTISQQRIAFYINNWNDYPDDNLTIEQYEAASKNVKKYYTARIDYANRILGYERHKKDWKKTTNKLRILTVDSVEDLYVGILIYQFVSGSQVASAEIIDINATDLKITVKNITGTFVTTGGNIIYRYGFTDQYTTTVIESPHTEDNITEEESRFWSPLSYFDYERELNEIKRNVKILRSQGVSSVYANLDRILEE